LTNLREGDGHKWIKAHVCGGGGGTGQRKLYLFFWHFWVYAKFSEILFTKHCKIIYT